MQVGAAQTAQGQALFLQQKLRQFEESAAAEEQESSAAAAKPKAKPGKGKAKGGGFLGVLKQQVKKAKAKPRKQKRNTTTVASDGSEWTTVGDAAAALPKQFFDFVFFLYYQ